MWRVDAKRLIYWAENDRELGMDFNEILHSERFDRREHNGGIIIRKHEKEELERRHPDLIKKDLLRIQQCGCGKCISCRLQYSRVWANRCMLESKLYEHNCFVTLTYADEYLKWNPYVDPRTGEVYNRPMLCPEDLQQFMKSLRQRFERNFDHVGIRFHGCGEYGDLNGRPHYHLTLFNCDFPDAKRWQKNPDGWLYRSEILDSVWNKGIAVTSEVSWLTMAYISRYSTKKLIGLDAHAQVDAQKAMFPEQPWQHEFVRSSRRPGIARAYYDEKKAGIYEYDEIFIQRAGKIIGSTPPRYFDDIWKKENELENVLNFNTFIKPARQNRIENNLRAELLRTGLTEEEYLQREKRLVESKSQKLIRPLGDI